MTPSTNLIAFIKKEEGCVLHAYRDQASIWTIGIGSTMYPSGGKVKEGDQISQQRAEEMLMWELTNKAAAVNGALVNTKVTQNQFDSLCDFAYNAGVGVLQGSTLIKKVRNNPNDDTMIPIADVPFSQVKAFMGKHSMSEINTIHLEFMKWVYITDPVTKEKKICDDLVGRRNREYKLYATK